jgi:putative ABC transport system permease protein
MKRLVRLIDRLRFALFRHRGDTEMAEEFESHIRMQTDENIRAGMTPDAARRNAAIRFGAAESVKDKYRDQRGLPLLETIRRDCRFALRLLRKDLTFTVAAVTILAIGIGVNVAVFRVTNAVLFNGFRFVDNERLVYIANGYGCCVSWPDFEDWRSEAKSFEGMAVVQGQGGVSVVDKSGFAERYDAMRVSSDVFKLAGQKPILGRDFLPSDELTGAAPVTILRYSLWEQRFAKDPTIIGQTLSINGTSTTIIGVMPQGFSFPQNQDFWVPLVPTAEVRQRDRRNLWCVVGRLAEGVQIQTARAEMESIGRRLAQTYPATNRNQLPIVQTFSEFFVGANAAVIYGAMWGAVGIVLLIVCANLSNLVLARALGRSREIAVRIALGAGRWRVSRQLLIESMLVSVIGGVLGWWIAELGVRIYQVSDRSWRVLDYTIDYRTLIYLLAVSLATGMLFGIVPALRAAKLDVNITLKDGGRGLTSARAKRVSSLLVTTEVALAVVLLAGAGVMVRSLAKLYTADRGFNSADLLTMNLALPPNKYSAGRDYLSYFDRLQMGLQAVPGVEAAAIANSLPGLGVPRLEYELAGSPAVADKQRDTVLAYTIGPSYFHTLAAPIVAGREFSDSDRAAGLPVIIVNQRFVDKFWPGDSALDKHLRLFKGNQSGPWLTVIGVASNIAQNALTNEPDPLVYLPYSQNPLPTAWLFVRSRVPPETLTPLLRQAIHKLEPELSIGTTATMPQWFRTRFQEKNTIASMFLIFAAIALLLASIGLYAVVSHSVTQRSNEIGIRIAIGASNRDIRALVLQQALVPLAVGVTVGVMFSFVVNPLLKSELVHVSPTDPLTLMGVSVILILSATLGCWIPVRRAMRVDPVVALRHE